MDWRTFLMQRRSVSSTPGWFGGFELRVGGIFFVHGCKMYDS